MSRPPESVALWRVAFTAPPDRIDAFEAFFGDEALAFADYIEEGDPASRRIEVLLAGALDAEALRARFKAFREALDLAPAPEPAIEPVASEGWVERVNEASPPLWAGRYCIHGGHAAPPRRGEIAIRIDAGRAFGTGRHPSTAGCLLALHRLTPRARPVRALDLGCGSGVLAIAIAKAWRIPVFAADNDPLAVKIAHENARRNGVAAWVQAVGSDGFAARALKGSAPYSLIVANILARPLARLAAPIARHLAPEGHAVLSGLLEAQALPLLARCRGVGLRLDGHIRIAGWSTLMLSKRPSLAPLVKPAPAS